MIMNPPPPRPEAKGSTTPSVRETATAAFEQWAAKLKAPVIEIHTGAWCDAVVDGHADKAGAEWQRIVAGAKLARSEGLEVHAGHGLDYGTAETIAALPEIVELNIGYYMMGEALFVGLGETVRTMRAAMDRGRSRAPES